MKDKSDRATVEQVLDPRTRIILFKMLSRGIIKEINGVISTGKEVLLNSPRYVYAQCDFESVFVRQMYIMLQLNTERTGH